MKAPAAPALDVGGAYADHGGLQVHDFPQVAVQVLKAMQVIRPWSWGGRGVLAPPRPAAVRVARGLASWAMKNSVTTYLAAGQRLYRFLVLVLPGDVQGCGVLCLMFLDFGCGAPARRGVTPQTKEEPTQSPKAQSPKPKGKKRSNQIASVSSYKIQAKSGCSAHT